MTENLYIQVDESGNCVNHPAYESNLIQAFGSVPNNWQPFIRIQRPNPKVFEVLESDRPVYQKIDGVWKDVWSVRPMTIEERAEKQKQIDGIKAAWAARPYAHNWSAWTFDEDTLTFVPPIPHPEPVEGKIMVWCGAENNWREAPPRPEDGKQYRFNFDDWVWFEVEPPTQ